MKFVLLEDLGDMFNLAFGDVVEGQLIDSVISNNQDIVTILNTVAKCVYEFLEMNPGSVIRIDPYDEKRKRLYNTIFQRKHQEIAVMTEENIRLFPREYQDFFAQLQQKGASGIFPERKKIQVAENRAKYRTHLQRLVLDALEMKPDATVREILEIALPKLPREVAPAYLTDLVQCAGAMLSEQEIIV